MPGAFLIGSNSTVLAHLNSNIHMTSCGNYGLSETLGKTWRIHREGKGSEGVHPCSKMLLEAYYMPGTMVLNLSSVSKHVFLKSC